jgi:hypothetical protein
MEKMSTQRKLFVSLAAVPFCCAALAPVAAPAQDRVVVIPLFETAGPPAPVAKTGQTTAYATGDDGSLQKGVAAPTPRFTDNGNGTVTDRLTGLVWLKDGICEKFWGSDSATVNPRPWAQAVQSANLLAAGSCGLNDGSKAGDWRLPNRKELDTLIDLGQSNPALPEGWPLGDSVLGVFYWTSTTVAPPLSTNAWAFNVFNGLVFYTAKTDELHVRPVRGGQ